MNPRHALTSIACAALISACSPAQPISSDQNAPAAPQDVPQAPAENRDAQIEIVIHHPGANQKNIYLTLHSFHDSWKTDDGLSIDPNLVDALRNAASQSLIEADAPYGCRSVEKGRQIHIRFKFDGHDYNIMSASNCSDFAPFNVSLDGKRFVQISGEIGQALIRIFENNQAFTAQMAHLKPGFIDFTKPLPQDVDDSKAAPQAPLVDHYKPAFDQNESIRQLLETRKIKENLPELEPTLELGCNQAKSPSCDILLGRYTIPIIPKVLCPVTVALQNNTVNATFPPDFETAKRAFKQPAMRAFIEHAPSPIAASWASPQDCPVIEALAPWFHADQSPKNCSKWTFTSADKAQTLIFYPKLNAVWIADSSDTLNSALKPLESRKALPKPTKSFIKNLSKQPKSPRNIFLDGNSALYVFETNNNKTTCTICPN